MEKRRKPTKRKPVDKERLRENQVISGSIAGFALATIIQISTKDTLDVQLKLSLFFLAITTPCSIALFLIRTFEIHQEYTISDSDSVMILWITSLLGSAISLACLFWHFNLSMLLAFLLCSTCAAVVWFRYTGRIAEANEEPQVSEVEHKEDHRNNL